MNEKRTFKFTLRPDDAGYVGRQCHQPDCGKYFKVKPGTGITACPDCGTRNSLGILETNLGVVEKFLALAVQTEPDVGQQLVGDSLENAVAAFDAFGRNACRVAAAKASDPRQAEDMSFQNVTGARRRVHQLFGFDFATTLDSGDWTFLVRCFEKRHLLAHKLGVVGEKYIQATGDPVNVGQKIPISNDEVRRLAGMLRRLGRSLALPC